MLERFRRHLLTVNLDPDGPRVLVGYSGGADSTCLVHLLARCGFDLVAAHLHHGQRIEADDEQSRCRDFAESLGIGFATGRADVPALARDSGIGVEEAGRNARYAFFDQVAFRFECGLIATAHTRDDLVETMLLNLTRGSSLAGLRGIPSRRGRIVRPMLPFSRAETRAYCQEHGLWFHDDPCNDDLSFARPRVRHNVLPELGRINPAYAEAFARFAEIAEEEDAFLDGVAAASLEHHEEALNGELAFLTRDCEVAFSRPGLSELPRPVLRRALRLAAGVLGAEADFDLLQDIAGALRNEPKGARTFPGGAVTLEWDDSRVHLRQLVPTEPFRYPLTVPGETFADSFGWVLTAQPAEPASYRRPPRSLDVVLDPAALREPLTFRSLEDGDRMRPLGLHADKKLGDLMTDAKLTPAARRRLPIVCDVAGVIWVPGVALAQRVEISETSERGLRLSLGPIEPNS